MKDLYRCLSEYPEALLQAIGEGWGISLPKEAPLQMVKRLAEGMLAPEASSRAVASLSKEAREALAYLQSQGNALPMRAFALRYGSPRRFGPARLSREKPWSAPQNPTEELYFKGLIYRAYGALQDFYGDLVLIPDDLAKILPLLEFPSFAAQLSLYEAMSAIASERDTLLEDLVTLLAAVRRQPLRAQGNETAPPIEEWLRFSSSIRLQGSRDPARLALIARLMARQGLLKRDGRQWRIAQEARLWLQQSDAEQWLATFAAWRDDPANELANIPSLLCEEMTWDAGAKARFCKILAQCESGKWYALENFIQVLRHRYPDYLRSDGDFDTWLIRDAHSRALLQGLDAWDAIEGALARHLLTGPLYWLGIVDVGFEKFSPSQPVAFRLTAEGQTLLAGRPPVLSEPRTDPPAVIDHPLTVRIALRNTRYLRYNLERLAENVGSEGEWGLYRLTEESIWQAQNGGIQISQILAFLRRITGGHIPSALEAEIRRWGQRFGRVSIRRAILLEAAEAATLQEIRKIPEISRLLTPIGPTRYLVEHDSLEELVERLKKRGIWPQIKR